MAKIEVNQGDTIVLNRMYVGDYLTNNLGHEVINMFQADNGGNYIYLNSTGDFVNAHKGQVRYMLFVKYYGIGEVEVIGMATGLRDIYDADTKFVGKYDSVNQIIFDAQQAFAKSEGGITYGGVPIFKIFGQSEQQSVFITYKAQKVYVPKSGVRLFLRFHLADPSKCPTHADNDIVVMLKGYQQAKASLKQYIYREGTYKGDISKENIDLKKKDYTQIREKLIDDMSLWVESTNKVDNEKLHEIVRRKVSLFDICQIQNSENLFSNALEYFITRKEYDKLWNDFFGKFDIELGDNFSVTREESAKIEDEKSDKKNTGRIDLMIRTPKAIIVIENKIKSDINSIDGDGDGAQLRRYYDYAEHLARNKNTQDAGKKRHYIVLSPKYNVPEVKDKQMRKKYIFVTYKDLYDFLEKNKSVFEHDANFVAFFEAMKRHTYENVNDYLYYDMQEKFFRRIADYNNQPV